MFYTFKSSQSVPNDHLTRSEDLHPGRRSISSRACDGCRQRKRRCNGQHPCQNCVWYHTAASCHYTRPRERAVPARSSSGKAAQTLDRYRSILQDVFPSIHPDDLHKLSKEERAQLIRETATPVLSSPGTQRDYITPHSTCADAEDLETLQPVPDEQHDTPNGHANDRTDVSQDISVIKNIDQDVNALPLSLKHPTSFLGVSMPPAVLRVIRWLYPDCMDVFSELQAEDVRSNHKPHAVEHADFLSEQGLPDTDTASAWAEVPLINAYFAYFHPSQPLLDERYFRDTYMSQKRKDTRWALLVNVVLALGSIAAGTADDLSHKMYYGRAKGFLEMEALGVHWETVQALGLLGGVYLHHVQRPDEAIAMLGYAMRLALALGLHRDCSARLAAAAKQDADNPNSTASLASLPLTMEMRSRIWWTLFNMDTWGCNGTGRPSMGRVSNAVTVKVPTEPIGGSQGMTKLFQDSVAYCMISTRIEDAMALSPLIDAAERKELDHALTDWFQSSSVQTSESTGPTRITSSKNVLRWRYHLSRIILHRPLLLLHAMRKTSSSVPRPEQRESIDICRKVAGELITDIATTWQAQKACQFSGTHATWIMYQAAMVPLLSLFSDYQDSSIVAECRRQVAVVRSAMQDLHCWSIIGKQSLESVSLLYEASQRYFAQQHNRCSPGSTDVQEAVTSVPVAADGGGDDLDRYVGGGHGSLDMAGHQELVESDILDSLNWYTNWDVIDFSLDVPDAEW